MAAKGHSAGGRIRIGLSGWSYDSWKDTFYAGVKRADWLKYAASHFPTLEVNATFYREQSAKTLQRWHDQTPDDFMFAIKGHRVVTHRLRLAHAGASIRRQRDNARPLGDKLGCVLWQLPASSAADPARLADFVHALRAWHGPVHVLEFRHASWFSEETANALARAGAASCISHAADWPMWDRPVGPLAYLRLHGAPRTYASAYGPAKLAGWARRIADWRDAGRDVLVYFDNDAEGAAFRDAARLMELIPGAHP